MSRPICFWHFDCYNCFFAILAINAYARIEKTKQDAEEIEKVRYEAETHLWNIGGITKTIYEVAIDMVEMSGRSNKDEKSQNIIKKRRQKIYRDYYRLGLKPFLFHDEERIDLIINLRKDLKGLEEDDLKKDLDELERICVSDTESPQMKNVAKEVYNSIKHPKPTIIHQSRCGCIKLRIKTFFKGQCELFKGLFQG